MSLLERPHSGQVSQEITVPASLPMVLKQFCKAAIRTQPYDLLKWSCAYFRALADGEDPPMKLRLEYPPPCTASGLTFGFIRVLLRQFGDYNKTLPTETILHRWDCLCLDRRDFNLIMLIGKFRRKCQVKKFLAIALGLLGSTLFETMIMVCELFTHEPDGGSAMIPVSLFMELYGYLAGLRCDGSEREIPREGTTEFILRTELGDSNASTISECGGSNEVSQSGTNVSHEKITDLNVELELASKDDSDISKIEPPSEMDDKSKKSDNYEADTDVSSDSTLKFHNDHKITASQNDLNKNSETDISEGKENIKDRLESAAAVDDVEKQKLFNNGRKKRLSDLKLFTHYPDIPGIGPRVSAEEVATVAVWITECARCQENMVGPRNLRHFQCPPLNPRQVRIS